MPVALDPDSSEPLKVVAYFDSLVLSGAGLDGLLHGAAALSGTIAGADRHGRVSRRTPDGAHAPHIEFAPRSPRRECSAGSVWLEREGRQHANDEIVVERLAVALDLLETRRNPVGDLEIVLDPAQSVGDRTVALARLRIDPGSHVRVIATRPETPHRATPLSTLLPTRYGLLHATLCRAPAKPAPASTPAGIGQVVTADHTADSWQGAMIALQLAAPDDTVIDATDLGALLLVALAYDPESPHEDVRTVARLDPRSAHILRILVEADSLRSAAGVLGVHHSTLQAKHESLTSELGYDPRTITGRIRYGTAELLRRLTDPRALL